VDPRRNVPRAIMLIALIGGGIFVAVSYVTQLVHPGGVFEDSASAASAVALQIGGQVFGAVFLAGLVVAQFASGLAAQASASRLIYAMGRTRCCPGRSSAGLARSSTLPWVNLVVTGIVGLIAIFLDVATSTSFINFGAFTAFTLVNASVVFPALPAGQQRHYAGTVLAGARRGGPGADHQGLPGRIAVKRISKFLDGSPIELGLSNSQGRLQHLGNIRHRVAHSSDDAEAKFRLAALDITGVSFNGSPGKLLRAHDATDPLNLKRWVFVIANELLDVAGRCVG
jgi:putrescine importer